MHTSRTLRVLAVAYVVVFASSGIQLPLTASAMSRVGLSMSAIGIMWAARSALGAVGPALWGILADRRGDARPFAIAALLLGAALLMFLAVTTTAVPAIVLYALYGLLAAPAGTLIDGMVLCALDKDAHEFGRWRAWGTMGFGATALGGALLVDAGLLAPLPRLLFPACAVLLTCGAAVLALLPPLPQPPLRRLRDVLPVLRHPELLALFAVCTILWCSHVAFASFVTPLAAGVGIPAWAVGVSLAAAIATEAVLLRESPRVLKRFGGRAIILGVTLLAALRWSLLAFTTTPWLFIALQALHGITFGLFFTVLVSLVGTRVPPSMRYAAQGLLSASSFGLGGALGSSIVGTVLGSAGPAATWLTMAACAALAFVVAWRFVR